MTRRAKAHTGRNSPWELHRIERDANAARKPSFVDALQAAIESARLFQCAAAEALTENAAAVERVAGLIDDTCPLQAQRLSRLVGQLRGVAAELAGDAEVI